MTDHRPRCPRCAHGSVRTLYSSPVPGVWDVLQCGRCLYTWRTSERPGQPAGAYRRRRAEPRGMAKASECRRPPAAHATGAPAPRSTELTGG
ncbi:non-oxidative hydroxyarylic acid decarboxylases subunit D [Streptomyces sp. DHE17-7]|uniref:non-oxidative hydroxyarylic acid decarboxylases subunit D n=1 Tax=Streptomyces sp. DHE17-7 TaxID=2759949 RepID=UPI003FA78B09